MLVAPALHQRQNEEVADTETLEIWDGRGRLSGKDIHALGCVGGLEEGNVCQESYIFVNVYYAIFFFFQI